MSADNVTPIRPPAAPAFLRWNEEVHRTGRLQAPHDSISISVQVASNPGCRTKLWVLVSYCGTRQALLEAGCGTARMLGNCATGPRQPAAAEGSFWKRRAPTRRCPDRIRLWRRVSQETALVLPGVAELFPEGLPRFEAEPAPEAEEEREVIRDPQTAADWKCRLRAFCEGSAVSLSAVLDGKVHAAGRFRLDTESRARIQARMDGCFAELLREIDRAWVIDSKQPQRGAGVRLAIDNTRVQS